MLVLDEFTAHLNPALAAEVRRRLHAAHPDATIIEIAHDLDNITDSTWVAVMDQGRIVEQGSPADLLAEQGALYHCSTGIGRTKRRRRFREFPGRVERGMCLVGTHMISDLVGSNTMSYT